VLGSVVLLFENKEEYRIERLLYRFFGDSGVPRAAAQAQPPCSPAHLPPTLIYTFDILGIQLEKLPQMRFKAIDTLSKPIGVLSVDISG
jgi:hypothetical protein